MGQKVHPTIFRTGYIYGWKSTWVARRPEDYRLFLRQDVTIRRFLKKKLKDAGIAAVDIERTANAFNITLHTARPGVVIGRGGKGIEDLKKEVVALLKKLTPRVKETAEKKTKMNVQLTIKEVREPYLSAEIVMQNIIADVEKRVPFRRIAKQTTQQIEKAGAKGVKIVLAGRLDGAEIARTETFTKGKIPLQTLRSDIDYSRGTAQTIYGSTGIKVWIYRGDIYQKKKKTVKA